MRESFWLSERLDCITGGNEQHRLYISNHRPSVTHEGHWNPLEPLRTSTLPLEKNHIAELLGRAAKIEPGHLRGSCQPFALHPFLPGMNPGRFKPRGPRTGTSSTHKPWVQSWRWPKVGLILPLAAVPGVPVPPPAPSSHSCTSLVEEFCRLMACHLEDADRPQSCALKREKD